MSRDHRNYGVSQEMMMALAKAAESNVYVNVGFTMAAQSDHKAEAYATALLSCAKHLDALTKSVIGYNMAMPTAHIIVPMPEDDKKA